MTNIWKRSISMILAIVMVFGMLPVNAFATDTDNGETMSVTEPVETEPVQTDPVETDPVETESVETEPAETEPVETEPAQTEPEETDPVETEPVQTEPEETDPVEAEPEETDPVETESAETEPVETEPEETEPEMVYVDLGALEQDWDLATNEELFQMYAEQKLYGTEMSVFGTAAGARLTGDNKQVYDALVPIIKQIANGQRTSTKIAVGKAAVLDGVEHPVDAEMTFSGSVNMYAIVDALMADLPYEMYWYDRFTDGAAIQNSSNAIVQLILSFKVNAAYRGGSVYSVDTGKTGAASEAAANAQQIVEQYKNSSDYEKLVGYKNEICDLVTYNHSAAESNTAIDENVNPWELIYVFDESSSTNVVCEGYSKAFQYLCDLTTFDDKSIVCYSVIGTMTGGTGAGNHMWNIVSIGGSNYLVDVTNSDEDAVGMDGTLFLVGAEGGIAAGYSFTNTQNQVTKYTYEVTYVNEQNETVVESTTAVWGEDAERF